MISRIETVISNNCFRTTCSPNMPYSGVRVRCSVNQRNSTDYANFHNIIITPLQIEVPVQSRTTSGLTITFLNRCKSLQVTSRVYPWLNICPALFVLGILKRDWQMHLSITNNDHAQCFKRFCNYPQISPPNIFTALRAAIFFLNQYFSMSFIMFCTFSPPQADNFAVLHLFLIFYLSRANLERNLPANCGIAQIWFTHKFSKCCR